MSEVWQNFGVAAPAHVAVAELPDAVFSLGTTLEVLHERTAESAFWGARRFRATWSNGRYSGRASVEIRPESSRSSRLVVHLEAPKGIRRIVGWDERRLALEALGIGIVLRKTIEDGAASPPTRAVASRTS